MVNKWTVKKRACDQMNLNNQIMYFFKTVKNDRLSGNVMVNVISSHANRNPTGTTLASFKI